MKSKNIHFSSPHKAILWTFIILFCFSCSWQSSRSNTCCSDCCCSIDVWGIVLNIILQDAPFLTFRLLIIIHYQIISYMNVFFTCNSHKNLTRNEFLQFLVSNFFIVGKNTLVILLQLYRLYVVHTENRKSKSKKKKSKAHQDRQKKAKGSKGHRRHDSDVYTISNERSSKHKKR